MFIIERFGSAALICRELLLVEGDDQKQPSTIGLSQSDAFPRPDLLGYGEVIATGGIRLNLRAVVTL